MTQKRHIRTLTATVLIALAAVALSPDASALKIKFKRTEKPKTDLAQWADSASLPSADSHGRPIFYPVNKADADSAATVTCTLEAGGLPADKIFFAALVYAVDNLNEEAQEQIVSTDYPSRTFTILLHTTQGSSSSETTHNRSLTVTALDGKIQCTTDGISVRYREKGLIPRTVQLDKLHPESSDRHKGLVTEFSQVNSAYVHDMAAYAATRGDISVTHISEIRDRNATEGMTTDEVKLAKGLPLETRKSGTKLRWIYGNDDIIVFTDGKVSRIVSR